MLLTFVKYNITRSTCVVDNGLYLFQATKLSIGGVNSQLPCDSVKNVYLVRFRGRLANLYIVFHT